MPLCHPGYADIALVAACHHDTDVISSGVCEGVNAGKMRIIYNMRQYGSLLKDMGKGAVVLDAALERGA